MEADVMAVTLRVARAATGKLRPERELEVELVRAHARGELAILVAERQPQLDDLQQVNIAAQRLVVEIAG